MHTAYREQRSSKPLLCDQRWVESASAQADSAHALVLMLVRAGTYAHASKGSNSPLQADMLMLMLVRAQEANCTRFQTKDTNTAAGFGHHPPTQEQLQLCRVRTSQYT